MDPLSALAIATGAAQFIEYGTQIVTGAVEIYKSAEGAAERNLEHEAVADRIKELTAGLDLTPATHSTSAQVSPYDKTLQVIVRDCQDVATQLLQVLGDVKSRGKHKLAGSLGAAAKAIRKDAKIQKLHKKLLSAQSQLSLCLVAMIQYVALKPIKRTLLADALPSEDQGGAQSAVEKLSSKVKAMEINQSQSSLLPAMRELAADMAKTQQLSSRAQDLLTRLTNDVIVSQRQMAFIEALRYPVMQLRENNIPRAHDKTYEWILANGPDPGFTDWLASDHGGIYWVAGKPGCGKSTLLKLVCSHEMVHRALRRWAGSTRLVVAAHFFWYAGYDLQKSQEGLLRTLLDKILTECPHLIPVLCPRRWANPVSQNQPWPIEELWDVCSKITELPVVQAKFCFFVDGLDEYSGNHDDIASIVKSLARCSHIKICVSSREWAVFDRQFDTNNEAGDLSIRKIRLQDYTKADIRRYVTSRLEPEKNRQSHRIHGYREALVKRKKLADEVSDRAQGVFLWVSLVCDELARGHDNHDSWEILLDRLCSLPTELEAYFSRMIQGVDRVYWHQSSMILGLLVAAEAPLPLNFFDSIETPHDEPNLLLPKPQKEDDTPQDGMYNLLAHRIKARAADLVEVYPRWLGDGLEVGFMHRSVHDFLSQPTQQRVLAGMLRQPFNAHNYLCRQHVRNIGSICHSGSEDRPVNQARIRSDLPRLINSFTKHMQQYEIETTMTDEGLLDELDSILSSSKMAVCPLWKIGSDNRWSSETNWTQGCIFELAVSRGLLTYVSVTVDHRPELLQRHTCATERSSAPTSSKLVQHRSSILNAAVNGDFPRGTEWARRGVALVRLLLDKGVSPNEYFEFGVTKRTPWMDVLAFVFPEGPRMSTSDEEVDIVVAMIEAGACDHFFDKRTQLSQYRPETMLTRSQLRRLKMATEQSRRRLVIFHVPCYIYGWMSLLLLLLLEPFDGILHTAPYMSSKVRSFVEKAWPVTMFSLHWLIHGHFPFVYRFRVRSRGVAFGYLDLDVLITAIFCLLLAGEITTYWKSAFRYSELYCNAKAIIAMAFLVGQPAFYGLRGFFTLIRWTHVDFAATYYSAALVALFLGLYFTSVYSGPGSLIRHAPAKK